MWGSLEGPQVRNLNRRDGRWPRPPLVSVDSFGSLCHLRWQVSRLLNHSRFPNGRAHGFAAPLRVALGLRPKCPGCSIIRASLTVALMVSLPRFGSLWSLRAQVPTGHTLPFGPPSGRFAAFGGKCPGCSIIRASLTVALMVSLPRFGSLCRLWRQQPTGLALPSAPPGWRFPPVPQNLCRSTKSKRCERPKAARNAAHSTRIVFAPAIRGHRGIIPPAAHLFAPLRQGLPSCAPKSAIKPYQQRSQSP